MIYILLHVFELAYINTHHILFSYKKLSDIKKNILVPEIQVKTAHDKHLQYISILEKLL